MIFGTPHTRRREGGAVNGQSQIARPARDGDGSNPGQTQAGRALTFKGELDQ